MIHHLEDLANQSFYQSRGIDSDFLTPEEFSNFLQRKNSFAFAEPKVYKEDWERKLIHFGPGSAEIDIIHIQSKAGNFIKLKHPDYLGSLTGLGIDRKLIGDIIASEDEAYVFAKSSISPYILSQLDQVGKASVELSLVDEIPDHALPKSTIREHVLSSLRLDRFVSTCFKESRKEAVMAIESGLIFIDGLEERKTHTLLEEGQRVSYRRKGKVRFLSVLRKTKKDSFLVQVEHYG